MGCDFARSPIPEMSGRGNLFSLLVVESVLLIVRIAFLH